MTAVVEPVASPGRVSTTATPLDLYDRVLHNAALSRPAELLAPRDPVAPGAVLGRSANLLLVDPAGGRPPQRVPVARWCGGLRTGDEALLTHCHAATLDVGCGPGRLAAALARRAVPVLGIDISAEAIRQARHRGAPARLACVLTSDLDQRWQHVLLADGNIGIGGRPYRLLARCAALLRPGGDLLVEVGPPGTASWAGLVELAVGGKRSTPFPWAVVGIDDIPVIAGRAGMRIRETWTEARRWFARISR